MRDARSGDFGDLRDEVPPRTACRCFMALNCANASDFRKRMVYAAFGLCCVILSAFHSTSLFFHMFEQLCSNDSLHPILLWLCLVIMFQCSLFGSDHFHACPAFGRLGEWLLHI